MVAARQIGSSNRSREQRVADKQVLSFIAVAPDLQADAAGTVARGVVRPRSTVAERNDLSRRVEVIDRRLRLDLKAEHPAGFNSPLIQKQVIAVQIHGHAEGALCSGHAGHVIHMRMGEEDVADGQRLLLREREQARHFIARIDENGLSGAVAGNDEPVLEERPDGLRLDYDHGVILAIVDDLMFTSKIKTAAGHLGVPIAFARSADAALAEMRRDPPALVILDLNSPRTDPLGTVGRMKADPGLADIPTVGFASHVQTDVIEAARKAGVDEVMARSMFTERLPDILSRGR